MLHTMTSYSYGLEDLDLSRDLESTRKPRDSIGIHLALGVSTDNRVNDCLTRRYTLFETIESNYHDQFSILNIETEIQSVQRRTRLTLGVSGSTFRIILF
jgi:hypothetical protein